MKKDRSKKSNKPIIVLGLFVILAGAALLYFYSRPPKAITPKGPSMEKATSNETSPEKTLSSRDNQQPADINAESTDINNAPETITASPCEVTQNTLGDFFSEIEKQEYYKAYEINDPLLDHTNNILIKLLNNPPIIVQETDNLFTLLKNTAHFYRLLGSKDVALVKDILEYEQDKIENVLAAFYQWTIIYPDCQAPSIPYRPQLSKLYEYAAFFLNTLGGQSYLFRRESTLRVLIKYYSLIIIDRAEQASLNTHGVDIRFSLEATFEEIEANTNLIHQAEYLDNLAALRSRYFP